MTTLTLELRRLMRNLHDLCSGCGRRLVANDLVVSGYDEKGRAARVGSCCEAQVIDEFSRHVWQPREYETPLALAQLWRYVDFAKFVAFLNDKAIYFSRVDRLGDRYEMAKGLRERKHIWDQHNLEYYRQLLHNPPPGIVWEDTEEELEEKARKLVRDGDLIGQHQLRTTYVSCWHESDFESEALWRLYCGTDAGVALQVRYHRLLSAFKDYPDIEIGRVAYIDFQTQFAGVNEAVFRKRASLAHEREVRAVHHYFGDDSPPGIRIPADLELLIERVVISPFAPDWFPVIVTETARRYGYRFEVVQSELRMEPFY